MIYNKLFRTRIVRAGLLLFLATILLAAVKPLLARQLERAVLAVARQTVMPDVLLAAGWNLASIPNAPDNSDPTAVFASINNQHSVTYGYDACAEGEKWQVYDPAALPGANDLTAVDQTSGFWVETTAATTLTMTGTLPPTSTLQLCAGWNLIGVPLAQARPVRAALASIEGQYTMVFGFEPDDLFNPWQGYDATAPTWSNTLDIMEPGRGYWVYATEVTTLIAANEGPPPIADITSPSETNSDLPVITTFTAVQGTVSSNLLESWTLAYRPLEGDIWTTIASGNTPLNDEFMGELDPTLLLNGMVELQLTAVDFQGQTATDTETVIIEGKQKVGDFSISFVDLNVPVAGLPLTLVRTYDSRDKASHDFGAGWTLDIVTGSYRNNRVPGDGWFIEGQGINLCDSYDETKAHLTEIRFSDVEYYLFKPELILEGAITGGCNASVIYTQIAGLPGASLELSGSDDVFWFFGSDELVTFGEDGLPLNDVFDPAGVTLTTVDGRQFKFTGTDGLTRISDPGGNTLTINDNNITHSSGKSVSFIRDVEGRITQITNPMGQIITYSYDSNGDLISHTNQEDYTTQFVYAPEHYLVDIIDPRGIHSNRYEYDEDGRLVALIDAEDNRTQIIHNLDDNQEVFIDALGNIATFTYDEDGNMLQIEQNVTIEGVTVPVITSYEYDAEGNVTQITDPDGGQQTATYNSNNRALTTATDPNGLNLIHTMTYGPRNQMTSYTDPAGSAFSNTFNGYGLVNTFTDALSNTHTLQYTSNEQLQQITDPAGTKISYFYNFDGYPYRQERRDTQGNLLNRVEYSYDENGNRLSEKVYRTVNGTLTPFTTQYAYDGLDRLTVITDTLGQATHIQYNEIGQETARMDALGHTTSFEYNPIGLLSKITYPDGSFRTFTYDVTGHLVAETNQANQTITYEYDEIGRQVKTIYSDGTADEVVYSPGGRLLAEIDTLGNRIEYDYDAAGRLITTTLPALFDVSAGALVTPTIHQEYDAVGMVTAVTDANGSRTEFVYNEGHQLIQTIFPDNTNQSQVYDELDRLIEVTDEEGRTTNYGYDALSRLITVTLPAPAAGQPRPTLVYTYDEVGNKLSQTDARNNTTSFVYDELNRLTEVTLPGSQTETYTYNEVGNLITRTDANNDTITFAYNELNQLTQKLYPDGTTTQFTYTPTGRRDSVTDSRGVTTYAYNDLNQLAQITHPTGEVISYTYGLRGNLASIAAPGGTTTYSYNTLGMLESVTTPQGQATYGYDAGGRLRQSSSIDGVYSSYQYNERNFLTSLTHQASPGGTTLASFAYQLADTGRRATVTEEDGSVVAYTYDDLDRLTHEVRTGTYPYDIAYEYDAVGNRTRMVADGQETLFNYDVNDRLLTDGLTTFAYDNNGNTIQMDDGVSVIDYDYDYDNRLITATSGLEVFSYLYDADGHRVSSSSAADTTTYLVDSLNPTGYAQVLEERDGAGNLQASYAYGHDMLTVSESSQTYSYLHDGQRNARLLTEAGSVTDSYAFDAFGNLVGSTGTTSNPYLYTGEQFDAGLGFTYLRARYYNPAIGRFVTRDPFAGFANDPVSLHKYLYAHANPANMIDPSGHFSLSEFSVVSAIQNTFRTSPVVAGIKTICAAKATADNITYAAMAKQVVDALKVLHYGYDVNQAGASGSIFNGQQSPIPGTSLRLEVEHPLSNFPTARKFLREGHIKKVVLKHLWKTGNQFHHVEPWLEFEVEPFVGGVLGAEFSYASASRFAETAALKGGHSLSVLTLDVCGIDYMEMALGLEGKISTNTGSGEITADAKWTILGFIEVKVGLAKATSDGDLELFPGLK